MQAMVQLRCVAAQCPASAARGMCPLQHPHKLCGPYGGSAAVMALGGTQRRASVSLLLSQGISRDPRRCTHQHLRRVTCAAVIMQLHAGWIAFIQTRVLNCLGCLWFNRNEVGRQVICEASCLACTLPQVPTVWAVCAMQ